MAFQAVGHGEDIRGRNDSTRYINPWQADIGTCTPHSVFARDLDGIEQGLRGRFGMLVASRELKPKHIERAGETKTARDISFV